MHKVGNQKGFSVIDILLATFVVALIAIVAWLAWNKQHPSNSQATQSVSAVEIKEWDIKLNTAHADKLTYNVHNESGTLVEPAEAYDSVVTFEIKPELVTDKECSPGINLYRLEGSSAHNENTIKIGDRYYTTFGAPGICSNDTDTDLKTDIIRDIKAENLRAL